MNHFPKAPSTESLQKFNSLKNKHLLYSIVIDIIGMLSVIIPVIGGGLDLVWAPISAGAIYLMYKSTALKAKAGIGGLIGFVEEILPFTDYIPTATLMWVYTYYFQKEKTIARLAERK